MDSSVLPKSLQPGATVAFVSLSARLNDVFPLAVSRGAALLSNRGYTVRVLFNPDQGIQSSITNRLAEIRSAFFDSTISAIICTIGGGSFTELIPSLIADRELQAHIRAHPKIVVGYSDMTGLHWFLHAMTGLRTFYGPSVIPELGTADSHEDRESPLAFCIRNLFEVISQPKPLGDVPRSEKYAPQLPPFFQDPTSTEIQKLAPTPSWTWLRPGKAQGRLFGGCLSVVARLNGIRSIAPDWRGCIVFIETSVGDAEDIDQIRTGIADLIAQGVFDQAAGLIVGRPFGYDSETAREEFLGVVKGLLCDGQPAGQKQFPILLDIDIGHTTPMVTLPFGGLAMLDSETNQFALLEAGVI